MSDTEAEDLPETPPAAAPDPDDPDAPAPDAATPPASETEKPSLAALAADVMKRRDASQLQALVREKRQLEAERAKLKEGAPGAERWSKLDRLLDEDPAAAIEYIMAEKAGDPERARAILATAYDGLTSRILGVESKATPATAKVERSVSRLEKELEELKAREAQAKAELAAKDAQEQDRRIADAVQQVSSFLTADESQAQYPYLLAEADAPEDIVWGILHEAHVKNISLTVAEAAALANEHFQPAFEKKAARYQKHLSAPTKANDASTKPETPKSQNGASRKSLTNADASRAAPDAEKPKPKTDKDRFESAFDRLRRGNHAAD